MYVSRLWVKGYRSLKSIAMSFQPGLNILVGKNNAGKSNIISALDLLLGEKWPTYVDVEDRDFYQAPEDESADAVLVAVELRGNGYSAALLQSGSARGYVWSDADPPDFRDPTSLEADPSGSGQWYDHFRLGQLLVSLDRLVFYIVVPRQSSSRERTLGAYAHVNGRWYHIRRFGAPFRDAILTTARIPSFRDPAQVLRVNQYSWYGKLIRALYESRSDDKAREIAIAQATLADVVAQVFQDVTFSLSQRLGRAIFHNRVTFLPGAFTRDDAYKQITMFVDDGVESPYYDKGSGIQSALVIALFAFYCEHFHSGGSLLLAEEPELYLHPQARRAIEAQLTEFATGVTGDPGQSLCQRQVIISTHSVEFLRSVELHSITCVRKQAGQTQTEVRQFSNWEESTLTRWRQAIRTKNAEMLFADHVILVEGGEEYLLPPLADLRFGERGWLDAHNISVVRADGKMQFPAYVDILKQLGIGYTILTDLDYVRRGLDADTCEMSDLDWQRLGELRTRIREAAAPPTGSSVKSAFSPQVRDWQSIYFEIAGAIRTLNIGDPLDTETLEKIGTLWARLEDRVIAPDIRPIIRSFGGIEWLLDAAKEQGVHILSEGELEDYLTDESLGLADSKDRVALAVGGKLAECADLDEASQWINHAELIEMLESVARVLGISEPGTGLGSVRPEEQVAASEDDNDDTEY